MALATNKLSLAWWTSSSSPQYMHNVLEGLDNLVHHSCELGIGFIVFLFFFKEVKKYLLQNMFTAVDVSLEIYGDSYLKTEAIILLASN